MALAASSLLPLSLAFGLVSPEWIVRIPFLANIAHLDNTFTCALLVLWSVLAGVGFQHAAVRLGTREGRADLLITGLLLFGMVFAWVGFRHASHRPIFGLGQTFSPLLPGQTIPASSFVMGQLWVLLTALVVLAWAVRTALLRRRITSAGGILLALCGIVLIWRTGLHASTVGYENYVARPTVRANFHARSTAHRRDESQLHCLLPSCKATARVSSLLLRRRRRHPAGSDRGADRPERLLDVQAAYRSVHLSAEAGSRTP